MALKKVLTSVFVFAFVMHCNAQTTSAYAVTMPQVLPASPEPSAFVKSGVANVNMSTGAVGARIPLYDLKLKDFTFPLFLSYSSQGLKADEACSRVGMGWVLNAGGMITRSVKGQPDELTQMLTTPTDFTVNTDRLYSYLDIASDYLSATWDTQADEFQFNVNGYSGKFVLDTNNVPRLTSQGNLKIAVEMPGGGNDAAGHIDAITITTPDGIKYSFGSAYEVTTTHNIVQYGVYKSMTKTAFFLDRVDLPSGENMLFHYGTINSRVSTGYTQTLQDGVSSSSCSVCGALTNYSSQENRIEYSTRFVDSINVSNGLVVAFSYGSRGDLSYDNRLTGMEVRGLKKYAFDYYDVPYDSVKIMGRFFLTKVRDTKLSGSVSTDSSYDYTMGYNNLSQVPLPISFSQDYYGYYNGKNNHELVPPALNSLNTIDWTFRNPVGSMAMLGMLTSIQYPTGGVESYTYEGNTQGGLQLRNTYITSDLEGNGTQTYTNSNITVKRDQTATLSGYAADAILDDDITADSTHKSATIYVYEGTTLLASRAIMGYASTGTTVSLVAGHTYKLQMLVYNSTERGYCSLQYDSSDHDIYDWVNTTIPGVRLRGITYTDPVTQTTHGKYYTYGTMEHPEQSSGTAIGVVFKTNARTSVSCSSIDPAECDQDVYSSSATQEVNNYAGSGSLIYYNTVIESDDVDFAKGGTEYTFYENDDGSHLEQVKGEEIPYMPGGQFPTLSGMLYKTRVFNQQKQVLREETDTYQTLIDMTNAVPSYYVRRKWTPNYSDANRMDAYDVVKMVYSSYWIRLQSKLVTSYTDGIAMTEQTDYAYNALNNVLPSSVTSTDSKGNVVVTESKYPYDVLEDGGVAVQHMLDINMVSPVMQQVSYKNGLMLQRKATVYKDWYSNYKVIQPQTIQVKASPSDSLHDELSFTQYDATGNPQQFNKVDNLPVVYLWDSVHSLPVCEVTNANFGQVAFCGFEPGAGYGNWTVSTGGVVSAAAFTGNNVFTGTLTRSIGATGVYKVSLWTKNSVTVNGATGTVVKTKRGWSLYEWTLTNPSTVTVVGTAMDDVRLFPQSARMTTYTYIPFVGVSSKSDARNDVLLYEYDYRNRLSVIKDNDGNIVKTYQYHYKQ